MAGFASAERSWVAEGGDVDTARALYQDEYNGLDFSLEPVDQTFGYRLTSIGDTEVNLRSNTVRASMRGTYMVSGQYLVTWFTAGAGTLDVGRDEVDMVTGFPVMSVRDRPVRFDTVDHRQSMVHLGAGFLEAIAAERHGSLPGPITFDSAHLATPTAAQAWMSTMAAVARVLHDPNAGLLQVASAKRSAAVAVLDTFAHEITDTGASVTTLSGARLRRAVDFLHANAHRPITTQHIADAAGLSIRGVQESFRRTLDSAPLEVLREVRLERVHEELVHADASTSTVSEAAKRWGFMHLGRFAATYAARFGESPSTTLRTNGQTRRHRR
jgi:AraC-like DNA-binding protein